MRIIGAKAECKTLLVPAKESLSTDCQHYF